MTNRTKQFLVVAVRRGACLASDRVAVAGGRHGRPAGVPERCGQASERHARSTEAALKGAYDARIDAAVKAGKITKEQGDALKKRAAEGGLPLFGGGPHGGRRPVSATVAAPRSMLRRPTSA